MNKQFTIVELNDIYYALGVTHQNQVNNWIRAKRQDDKEMAEFYSQQMAQFDVLMKKVDKMVEEEYNNTIAVEKNQFEGQLEEPFMDEADCEYLTIPSDVVVIERVK